jgi:hypothetical protein
MNKTEHQHYERGYNDGTKDVMALDLPVKFAEWRDAHGREMMECDRNNIVTLEELYQYWIENIYKPE